MPHWRFLVVLALLGIPILFLVGCGTYFLWETGLGRWLWWPLSTCLAMAFILGWHWQKKQRLLRVDFTPPLHWTERDRQAWNLVQARATAAARLDAQTLGNLPLYINTASDMALELARFYHPGARDPIGSLTIPEILAVVELASQDLARMVDQYLPGGNLLTIDAWRKARQAAEWYQTASNLTWLISSLFAPVETSIRFLASQAGMGKPWQKFQQNLLLWFYSAYVHRLGSYLIDLNSGRLRVGAERYRQLLQEARGTIADAAPTRPVTLALVGQTKAGKSSLINALLGEQRARTDVVPATREITRYHLQPEGIPEPLILLDTPGYAQEGLKPAQREAIHQAARQADLVLLVLHALHPGRQPDLDLLVDLRSYFDANPDVKMPPVLGIMTHVDLLSPALEWSPPYNWQKPARPKEEQIHQALEAASEPLGSYPAALVPVCPAEGKVWGVEENVLPAVIGLLGEARAVAMLRCLRAEADTGKIRKVLDQFLAASKEILKVLWQAGKK